LRHHRFYSHGRVPGLKKFRPPDFPPRLLFFLFNWRLPPSLGVFSDSLVSGPSLPCVFQLFSVCAPRLVFFFPAGFCPLRFRRLCFGAQTRWPVRSCFFSFWFACIEVLFPRGSTAFFCPLSCFFIGRSGLLLPFDWRSSFSPADSVGTPALTLTTFCFSLPLFAARLARSGLFPCFDRRRFRARDVEFRYPSFNYSSVLRASVWGGSSFLWPLSP